MNDRSFLGIGWGFPPSFTRGGAAVEMVSDADDIHQCLQILLSTVPGERIMRDDFGCDLHGSMFEEINQGLISGLTGRIADAVLFHEPRVTLNSVDLSESETQPGLLLIALDYSIRNTNSRYNMVFPFYLNESAAPGS